MRLKENIEINEKWCECVMLIVVFLNPSCLFRSKHIMMGTEILSFRFSPAFLVQQQILANVLYNLALMVTQICSVLQIKYSMVSIGTIFYSEIVFPKFRGVLFYVSILLRFGDVDPFGRSTSAKARSLGRLRLVHLILLTLEWTRKRTFLWHVML